MQYDHVPFLMLTEHYAIAIIKLNHSLNRKFNVTGLMCTLLCTAGSRNIIIMTEQLYVLVYILFIVPSCGVRLYMV